MKDLDIKSLITIFIILIGVGCGNSLTEEKLVGSYEAKISENTFKYDFLENGKVETFKNGVKYKGGTWKIVQGQVRLMTKIGDGGIFKREKNGDLTPLLHISIGNQIEEIQSFLSGTDSKLEQMLQERMKKTKAATFTYKRLKE